jgi:hypothetical protein
MRHLETIKDAHERRSLQKEIDCAKICEKLDPKKIAKFQLPELAAGVVEVRKLCKIQVPLRVHFHLVELFAVILHASRKWVELAISLRVYTAAGYHLHACSLCLVTFCRLDEFAHFCQYRTCSIDNFPI